jgi:hypothetical protein
VNNEEVTEQILSAWDEIEGTTSEVVEEEPGEEDEGVEEEETPETEEETEEEAAEPEPEEDAEDGEEQEEEPEVTAEAETATVTLPDDPLFRAWLSRYQGDVQKALEGAYQLEKVLGRQGQEKAVLTRKVQELESQLSEVTAFQSEPTMLTPEQQNWALEALESGSPATYVRQAVRAGEFGLARVICAEWGRESPYDALRAVQAIDSAEMQTWQQAQPAAEPVNPAALHDVLVEHFPDMPVYESQMVETMNRLGRNHHSVVDAYSPDPETAARGLINIYEIARASAATVAQTKSELRNGRGEAAASQRRKAVVSSAGASPSPGEAPRTKSLGPGLTLDQLDAEWEANS